MKTLLFCCFVLMVHFHGNAQINIEQLPPDHIKTITFQNPRETTQIPIIKLGNLIELQFDDINGDEADYYYKIEHFNFDWTKSQLMKSEYLAGLDDQHIQVYDNSLNTLQLYAHYTLRIPNSNVRIKKTGNYLLKIYDDEDELVFSKRFIVYQDQVAVLAQVKRARDLNVIETTQVVQFSIKSANLTLINPRQTVHTLVFQNNDMNRALTNLKPQYIIGNELIYRYDKEARFWAGNEFLYFDNKEIRGANISINYSLIEGDLYHNFLFPVPSRANQVYTYNPDINGDFLVKNLDRDNSAIEADYAVIHFKLENYAELSGKKIHVYGGFNGYKIDETTAMRYNASAGFYENEQIIKQGFVNYKYIMVDENNEIDCSLTGGNFYQTENDYTILVYYRPLGGRYDEVIGFGKASSINISN